MQRQMVLLYGRGANKTGICRSCDKKRNPQKYISRSTVVKVSESVFVSVKAMENARDQSSKEVLKTPIDWIAYLLFGTSFCAGGWAAILLLVSKYESGFTYLATGAGLLLIARFLYEPRRIRLEKRACELARHKKEAQDTHARFYRSTPWKWLRAKIIAKHGTICTKCGKTIRRKKDITVDHILPRSKRPDLSLAENNLQVLCRKCNSVKGASMPE